MRRSLSGWILAGSAALFFSSIAVDALAQSRVAPGRTSCDPRTQTDCFPDLVIRGPNGTSQEVSGTRADMRRQLIDFIRTTSTGPVVPRQVQNDVDDLLDTVPTGGRTAEKPKLEHKFGVSYDITIKQGDD